MAKVKGVSLIETVKFLRRHKDAARAALPQHLHHYLEERVLSASWYPEEDLVPLVRAIARIRGEDEAAFFALAGRLAAHQHAEGVYAHLVEAGDRSTLPRRAFALWSSQHDTGSLDLELQDAGRGRVVLRDFAVPSREQCAITAGYVAAILEMVGFRDVRTAAESCCSDGAPVCAWRLTWDPAS